MNYADFFSAQSGISNYFSGIFRKDKFIFITEPYLILISYNLTNSPTKKYNFPLTGIFELTNSDHVPCR